MMIKLTSTRELQPLVEPILVDLFTRLRAVVADAELHHVGATSIPGAVTKGDVDVLLRVRESVFVRVVERLRRSFAVKQVGNWTPQFASFGDESHYALPIGVQVVVSDSCE